jgi:hypothetical protein
MLPIREWSHRTVLAAEPESASRARDFVCAHLAAHELLHLIEDVRLVVSELAINALICSPTPFTVILARANGSVRLTVEDESTFDPIDAEPEPQAVSGRGLALVGLLSTDWGATTGVDGITSVWASFEPEISQGRLEALLGADLACAPDGIRTF